MDSISTSFVVIAVVYFCGIAAISFLGMRSIRSEDEFLTAGRSIGPWTGGAVLAATQISAGTMVGTVGRHYMGKLGMGMAWRLDRMAHLRSLCRTKIARVRNRDGARFSGRPLQE